MAMKHMSKIAIFCIVAIAMSGCSFDRRKFKAANTYPKHEYTWQHYDNDALSIELTNL